MATIDELGAHLVAEGVFTAVGTDLFEDNMPEDIPSGVVGAIVITPGRPTQKSFGSDSVWLEKPNAQIVVRANAHDYASARAKAELAHTAMNKVQAESLSGTFYHQIVPLQAPFFLKVDKSERPHYAFNVAIEKKPS